MLIVDFAIAAASLGVLILSAHLGMNAVRRHLLQGPYPIRSEVIMNRLFKLALWVVAIATVLAVAILFGATLAARTVVGYTVPAVNAITSSFGYPGHLCDSAGCRCQCACDNAGVHGGKATRHRTLCVLSRLLDRVDRWSRCRVSILRW